MATRIMRGDQLLSPGDVAEIFRVDPKTVSRWADQGRLAYTRTLGGHRRFSAKQVYKLAGIPRVHKR